ncbi:MAG: hypothetical protein WBX50_06465, partial [Candidatus Deferrimicrobiaceae bacterium]
RLGRVSGGSSGATDGKLPSVFSKHPPPIPYTIHARLTRLEEWEAENLLLFLFQQSMCNLPTQVKPKDTGKSTQKICSHKTYFFSCYPTEPAKYHDK